MTFQYDNRTNQLQIVDSGANASATFQAKGTGAINFAPGSSGLNLSNGGTVTAITRTNPGSSYTSVPSVAISAPTTAGGVQATATATMLMASATIQSGGTGYTVGDTLTAVGAAGPDPNPRLTVTSVSGGVITGISVANNGTMTTLPTNPFSVTGGTGTGATFNGNFWVSGFTITNAGSGYVEQPTVTFSGGGGSGAAAYATVGSGTTVQSLGSTMSFRTPGGEQFRVNDPSANTVNYIQAQGSTTNAGVQLRAGGSDPNIAFLQSSKGTSQIGFYTNTYSQEQLRVTHTASAVNYVQVTGAATGGATVISAQGSDSNVNINLQAKGSGQVRSIGWMSVGIGAPNYWQLASAASGAAPALSAQGSDTNISMAFQSKGTGAIDLAAGSSGVNISNGGTVTAITATNSGSAYTSVPTVTVSAPTTAGGVQATVTTNVAINVGTIGSGGTGYTVGDTLTLSGGTTTGGASTWTVATVSGGVVTSVTNASAARYTAFPNLPASVTGGTGSGFTFSALSGFVNQYVITNAGSGYVEQPTVTISGGGGSAAAAYATVGGTTTVKGLGTNIDVFTANANRAFRFYDSNSTGINFWSAANGTTPVLYATGSSNTSAAIITNGTGSVSFQSAGGASTQMVVTHTASAVNFVQVTGATTGLLPTISSQGSDANISLSYSAKGTASHRFSTNGGEILRLVQFGTSTPVNRVEIFGGTSGFSGLVQSAGTDTNIGMNFGSKGTGSFVFQSNTPSNGTGFTQFQINNTTNAVNRAQVTGAIAGAAPVFSVEGSDTNIGLNLTTKGTGTVSLQTGGGTQFQVQDLTSATTSIVARGGVNGGNAQFGLSGTGNTDFIQYTLGTGAFRFMTNSVGQDQMRITHTASAVNYVQVTGNASGFQPTISAQGSDANIGLRLLFKGNGGGTPGGGIILGNAAAWPGLAVQTVNNPNYFNIEAKAAGSAPVLSTQGSDTNIDLALTPKGTGYVQFGTYTGTALTIAGYIEIKDAGGTIRRLAVVA